jgi:hypothetical protein
MDEVTTRTEAKAIVVSLMCFFPAVVAQIESSTESDGPSNRGGLSWGRPWGCAVGGTGTQLMWVCDLAAIRFCEMTFNAQIGPFLKGP